jgi:hypothetical protein
VSGLPPHFHAPPINPSPNDDVFSERITAELKKTAPEPEAGTVDHDVSLSKEFVGIVRLTDFLKVRQRMPAANVRSDQVKQTAGIPLRAGMFID